MIESNWYEIKQLSEGLYGIGEPKHNEEVNSFLLVGTDEAILIDTGMGFESISTAVQQITDVPCQVLNTHSHFDHVGSNHEFSQVAMLDHQANRKAAKNGFSSDYLSRWSALGQFIGDPPNINTDLYSIAPFPQATFFLDGDKVGNSSFELEVIHTPGHSDDSVCFWDAKRGWLFSGDLLYDGPIYLEKAGGLAKFKKSISRITELNGLDSIFSSHNYFSSP